MQKLFILHPATFKLDGGAMFGIIPRPLWEKKIKPDDHNRINMSLRMVLIQDGEKNILVDTGIGHYHSDKFNQQFDIHNCSQNMEEYFQRNFQIGCDQITDIILTHLHFDHVGGLGKDEPVYKNATVHLHKKHFEYAKNATPRDAGSFHTHIFMPLLDYYNKQNQLKFVDGNEGKFEGLEVQYLTSFGHTPYMIHPIAQSHIYMADLVPMGHHVSIPWVMGYDIEPGVTTLYKQKFYDYIIANDLTMIFEHDIETWGGKLSVDDHGKYSLLSPLQTNGNEIMPIN